LGWEGGGGGGGFVGGGGGGCLLGGVGGGVFSGVWGVVGGGGESVGLWCGLWGVVGGLGLGLRLPHQIVFSEQIPLRFSKPCVFIFWRQTLPRKALLGQPAEPARITPPGGRVRQGKNVTESNPCRKSEREWIQETREKNPI